MDTYSNLHSLLGPHKSDRTLAEHARYRIDRGMIISPESDRLLRAEEEAIRLRAEYSRVLLGAILVSILLLSALVGVSINLLLSRMP